MEPPTKNQRDLPSDENPGLHTWTFWEVVEEMVRNQLFDLSKRWIPIKNGSIVLVGKYAAVTFGNIFRHTSKNLIYIKDILYHDIVSVVKNSLSVNSMSILCLIYIDNIYISISNHFHPPTKRTTSNIRWRLVIPWWIRKRQCHCHLSKWRTITCSDDESLVLLMAEIWRSPVEVGSVSHSPIIFGGFWHHPWGLFGIFSINRKFPLKLGLKKTNFVFQPLMFSGALQSVKTNMTMEIHHLKMYCLLKMEVFQCHVSFQGL